MNIFYLDSDPQICAEMHLDKHVVKMIIEYAQLLSTAHRELDGVDGVLNDEREPVLYKMTHKNHPSAIWVRQSSEHYQWLHRLWVYLCLEYTFRYGKIHQTETKLSDLIGTPPKNLLNNGFTEPPPAMPDEYKVPNDSILSYRNYYIHDKVRFASWKKREKPKWFNSSLV